MTTRLASVFTLADRRDTLMVDGRPAGAPSWLPRVLKRCLLYKYSPGHPRCLAAGAVGLGDFQYLGFGLAASEEKPLSLALHICCFAAETKSFIDEHEPIRLSMRKRESIVVPASVGAHRKRCFHTWAHTASAK